jgi:hypothetical protein
VVVRRGAGNVSGRPLQRLPEPVGAGECGEGVRRLYFVGDWVDDQCDLTMAVLEGQGIVAQQVPRAFVSPAA